jgi:protein SCO1/2
MPKLQARFRGFPSLMSRTTKIVLAVWVLALIGAGAWMARDSLVSNTGTVVTADTGSLAARIGGPFKLIDQNGVARTDQDFRGKLMLVYFGYTYCPDVCPTELTVIATALDQLGADAAQVAPIFITIDPERDTAKVMKDYVAQFSDKLVGLTGSESDIAAVAKAYRVYYAKAPSSDGSPYLMDHTSLIYLMDRNGRFLTHFTPNGKAEDIAAAIRDAIKNSPAPTAAGK